MTQQNNLIHVESFAMYIGKNYTDAVWNGSYTFFPNKAAYKLGAEEERWEEKEQVGIGHWISYPIRIGCLAHAVTISRFKETGRIEMGSFYIPFINMNKLL